MVWGTAPETPPWMPPEKPKVPYQDEREATAKDAAEWVREADDAYNAWLSLPVFVALIVLVVALMLLPRSDPRDLISAFLVGSSMAYLGVRMAGEF